MQIIILFVLLLGYDSDVFGSMCPHDKKYDNVLSVPLDPEIITKPDIYGERTFKTNILLLKQSADKIAEFLNKIDRSKPLKINCGGGNSRSGTTAWCINEFINKDKHIEDYNYFLNMYDFISIAPTIKTVLMYEFEKKLLK